MNRRNVSNLAQCSVSNLARVVMVLALLVPRSSVAQQQDVFADIEWGYLNGIGQSDELSTSNAAPSLIRSRLGIEWGRTQPASLLLVLRPDSEIYKDSSGNVSHWDGRMGPVAQSSREIHLLDAYEFCFDQKTGWKISTGVRESFDELWRINESKIPFGLRVIEPGSFYFAEVKWQGAPRAEVEATPGDTKASIIVTSGDRSRNDLIESADRRTASSSDSLWGGGAWFSSTIASSELRLGSFYENRRSENDIFSDLFLVIDSTTLISRMAKGSIFKTEARWRSVRHTKGENNVPTKNSLSLSAGLRAAIQELSYVDLNFSYGTADADLDLNGLSELKGYQFDLHFCKRFSSALSMSTGLGFEQRTRKDADGGETQGAFGSDESPKNSILKGMIALNYWIGRE